jgi:hypothetical protein
MKNLLFNIDPMFFLIVEQYFAANLTCKYLHEWNGCMGEDMLIQEVACFRKLFHLQIFSTLIKYTTELELIDIEDCISMD